jgi:hypothetical protein
VLRQARPLVTHLRPAVDELASASLTGRRLVGGLRPTVARLADDLVPYLASTDSDLKLPVYQLIGPTFAALGSSSAQYDDISHVINFPAQPGENSAGLIPCATYLTDPTAAEKLRCDTLNDALKALAGASGGGRP